MQLKSQHNSRRSRSQLLYARRSHTLPLLHHPSPACRSRLPPKTIKSLNVFCLAEIFDFLDYRDLINCRMVCSFWNECVDFHLQRRTHFAYGKSCNIKTEKKRSKLRKKFPLEGSLTLSTNLLYTCEKCTLVNQKMQHQEKHHNIYRGVELSPSPSPTTYSADESSSFGSSLSLTPISSSPPASPISSNYWDFEYRCNDCYRYGRLRQSCLEVSHVQLMSRIAVHCPNLTRLDLSNCVGLLESDFIQLVELYGKQLVSLNVSGCRIDENCLRVIVKGCDRLRFLNVANNFCGLKGGCFEWLSDSIETIVADYNQNVRLLDGLLQGKGREIIELELNVGYCYNAAMPYKLIGNHFHDLISLKITFKSFGPRKHGTFVALSKLNELECLYLLEEIDDFDSESSLDDDSVLPIMQSCGSRLRELYLHAASSLFGRPSSLTDASMVYVHELCPMLEVFSIKRASITDISLRSIARLKNAYSVHLIDLENISEHGVGNIMTSFKQIETQELETIKQSSGVDLNVNKNGPKIEKVKRHCSLTTEMETPIAC
ncbi:hypothetical protein RDWZM_001152 [Blomia tropicalis]|uniref:F-box domain-containing protein n=1 Tax=Blomia tropicalis TaxID=40697 RepID=A0A9Q0MBP7_BLOTA|nr:hypothetical protein RDWZM_001152 [Blomia tropicalis]